MNDLINARSHTAADVLPWLRIERGTRDDYAALAHWHYRAGTPATFARVLRAIDLEATRAASPQLAGVLVVSHPTLNGPWRAQAWPGAMERDMTDMTNMTDMTDTPDTPESPNTPASRARRLNAMVRTISRVIVDPRYRGGGVGSALVRAYLDDPLTPLTEAIASMGALVPLFTSAGMRAMSDTARSAHTAAMARALRSRRIAPWRLMDPREARRWCQQDAALVREARRWAGASRATRAASRRMSDASLLSLAAAGVAAPARVFVAP